MNTIKDFQEKHSLIWKCSNDTSKKSEEVALQYLHAKTTDAKIENQEHPELASE